MTINERTEQKKNSYSEPMRRQVKRVENAFECYVIVDTAIINQIKIVCLERKCVFRVFGLCERNNRTHKGDEKKGIVLLNK